MKEDHLPRGQRTTAKEGAEGEFFDVALLTSAHGIAGSLAATLLSDVPDRLAFLEDAYLVSPDRRQVKPIHLKARPHKGRWLVEIEGIEDRTTAEQYRNYYISITRTQAEPLPRGRYFVRDLIGFTVVDSCEGAVGVLADILTDRAQELYVITLPDGREALFPAVPDILREIDPEAKVIKVDLPAGLLDVYREG